MTLFTELAVILIITAVLSFLMRKLKQPLVVGYILSGIVVGPMMLNITQGSDAFELFAKIGITILLFIVGLHLRPDVIKEVGKVSLIAGVSQVLFTSIIGFGIALLLGLSQIAALYVSIALTFSSTIIILKLLSDKGHVHTLYGRISVGMLLVQDLIATVILLIVAATGSTSQSASLGEVALLLLLKTVLLVLVLFTFMKWLLPKLLQLAGESQELLFLFSIAWGLGLAAVFQLLGLSVEIGALVAGVMLSSSSLAEEVSGKLRPLRDFFIIVFFIMLGSHMEFSAIVGILPQVIIFSLFVLIGNPVIVFIVLNLLGYHKRTGFMTGLTVAQISEFSLILATLGLQLGHLDQSTVTIITLIGLITIASSTYMILYAEPLYQKVMHILTLLELRKPKPELKEDIVNYQALILGYTHIGQPIVKALRELDLETLVIDFNPAVIEQLASSHVACMYGDASNPEFLQELPTTNLKIVISGINDSKVNLSALSHIKQYHKRAITIFFSRDETEAKELRDAGATLVINALKAGSVQLANHLLETGLRAGNLKQIYRRG